MPRLLRLSVTQERTWQEALQEFITYKAASGLAPRTVRDYIRRVGKFFDSHPDAWGDYETLKRRVFVHFAVLSGKAPATGG